MPRDKHQGTRVSVKVGNQRDGTRKYECACADGAYLARVGLTDESSAFRRGDTFCVETETFDMRMGCDAG